MKVNPLTVINGFLCKNWVKEINEDLYQLRLLRVYQYIYRTLYIAMHIAQLVWDRVTKCMFWGGFANILSKLNVNEGSLLFKLMTAFEWWNNGDLLVYAIVVISYTSMRRIFLKFTYLIFHLCVNVRVNAVFAQIL